MIYKKHNINPMSGCLFAFLQLPIFFAFLEAIYRVPAFFEEKFWIFDLGKSPNMGLQANEYAYLIIVILIIGTTYFSFKNMNMSTADDSTLYANGLNITGINADNIMKGKKLKIQKTNENDDGIYVSLHRICFI